MVDQQQSSNEMSTHSTFTKQQLVEALARERHFTGVLFSLFVPLLALIYFALVTN